MRYFRVFGISLFMVFCLGLYVYGETQFNVEASVGTVVIDKTNYLQIRIAPDVSIGKLGFGLDLNFEFDGDWNLRKTEWNNFKAILSKIKYLRWGSKGDRPLYFKIGMIDDATLGHGFIMYYLANTTLYPKVKKLGINLDLDLDLAGFESVVDNIWDPDIVGARIFVRPLLSLSNLFLLNQLEVGVSAVLDTDPLDPAPPSDNPYDFKDATNSTTIAEIGVDLGLPIINSFLFSMMWYADGGWIINKGTGEATGFMGSILGFLPYRAEIRILQPHFLTPFFDSYYSAERYLRYEYLDTITEPYLGWLISSGVFIKDTLALSLQMEDDFTPYRFPRLVFQFQTFPKFIPIVQFSFIYDRRNIKELKDLVTFESVDALARFDLSFQVSESVAIIVTYKRSYERTENGVRPIEMTTVQTKLTFGGMF